MYESGSCEKPPICKWLEFFAWNVFSFQCVMYESWGFRMWLDDILHMSRTWILVASRSKGPYLHHSADLVGLGRRLAVLEQIGPLHVLQLKCLPRLVQQSFPHLMNVGTPLHSPLSLSVRSVRYSGMCLVPLDMLADIWGSLMLVFIWSLG